MTAAQHEQMAADLEAAANWIERDIFFTDMVYGDKPKRLREMRKMAERHRTEAMAAEGKMAKEIADTCPTRDVESGYTEVHDVVLDHPEGDEVVYLQVHE